VQILPPRGSVIGVLIVMPVSLERLVSARCVERIMLVRKGKRKSLLSKICGNFKMRIFVTGDTHGSIDILKLGSLRFKEGKTLTKEDLVIICGDFGLLWNYAPDDEEEYWTKWLNDKPWTTLFIDGNHENFNRLYALEEVDMFDGKVGRVSDSIFHLKRGQIYNINDMKTFVMGGGTSIDKHRRRDGISWWKEEIPSYAEFDFALGNLEKHNNKVDLILTHACPDRITREMWNADKLNCPVGLFLDDIQEKVEFKKWYCGHMHVDQDFGMISILYNKIVEIPLAY
jgi:hypothetical protein